MAKPEAKSEKRPRGRPRLDGGASRQMGVRIVAEDDAQLAGLRAKLPGFDEAKIARAALRAGLSLLELNPTAIVQASAPPPKRRAWLKGLLRDDDGGAR